VNFKPTLVKHHLPVQFNLQEITIKYGVRAVCTTSCC